MFVLRPGPTSFLIIAWLLVLVIITSDNTFAIMLACLFASASTGFTVTTELAHRWNKK